MTPEDYCHDLANARGSDFRYSLLGLPLAQRQALCAIQSFCLETAGIATECQDLGVARTKLDWWYAELDKLFAGKPEHPITCALWPHLGRFNLPQEHFRTLLEGVAMDLDYEIYPTFSTLTPYIHRRGSVAALLVAEVSGYRHRHASSRFAHEAGAALLLFERLYDVRQYAHLGRFYLPEDEIRQFGLHSDDFLATKITDRVQQLFAFQAQRIHDYHRRALEHLPDEDRLAQCPLLIRLELMMALLREITEEGYRLLEQHTTLTPLHKLWLAWRLRRGEQRRFRRRPVTE